MRQAAGIAFLSVFIVSLALAQSTGAAPATTTKAGAKPQVK
jgi:hypothetical protein